jgi:TolA-binding protein
MSRKLLNVFLLAAGLLAPASAWASGDFSCAIHWTLKLTDLTGCNNSPFLSPSNDSQVNLQLLLLDAGKAQIHSIGGPRRPSADDPYPPSVGPSPFTVDGLKDLLEPPTLSPSGAAETDRVEGEASRCDSNVDGATQFAAALSASIASPSDRSALLAARVALKPNCADDPKMPPAARSPVLAASPVGKQFAAYLAGAGAFYDGRYDAAAQSFGSLQESAQPWLKETARYMVGRVALNRGQASAFDEYGRLEMSKVDAKALADARSALEAYLRDYPAGAYAVSARGLLRRIDWLGGRSTDLARDFAQAFNEPKASNVTVVDLVQEADAKFLSEPNTDAGAIRDPLLLAVFDLQHMRTAYAKTDKKFLTKAALEAQKPVFAGREALFDYLRAAHALYIEQDASTALALLPKAAPSSLMTYLDFSRQMLRALALEERGDPTDAHALWIALMPQARPPLQHAALELGLAMNYERASKLGPVFAEGSPITDVDLRELLLTFSAGPDLLRQQARAGHVPEHERRVALYALLYKELTRNRYEAFNEDLTLLPPSEPAPKGSQPAPDPDFAPFHWDGHSAEGYACPPLKVIAQSLARDPAKAEDRICLGELVRVSNLDEAFLDRSRPKEELGGAPTQFPGKVYSRLEIYKALIADPKTPTPVRSYALYRAVQCYAPSGANHCGGEDVAQPQRKAWFQTLKTAYPASHWAKRLKYYW